MLRNRLTRMAYSTLVFLTMAATPALAQQANGGGCASFGAGVDTSQVDTNLKAMLNWVSGTPFKVMCGLSILVMIAVLAFDGGQLPQIVKTFLVIILCVFGALMIVSIIMGANGTCY